MQYLSLILCQIPLGIFLVLNRYQNGSNSSMAENRSEYLCILWIKYHFMKCIQFFSVVGNLQMGAPSKILFRRHHVYTERHAHKSWLQYFLYSIICSENSEKNKTVYIRIKLIFVQKAQTLSRKVLKRIKGLPWRCNSLDKRKDLTKAIPLILSNNKPPFGK